MHDDSPESTAARRRTIVQFASRDALAPTTGPILSRLGYRIVSSENDIATRELMPERGIDLLLVDERRLVEALDFGDSDDFGSVPIVLLCGRHGATGADSRIVGAVKRPAGLHDLYRLLQQVFEDTPRSMPRIATQLLAHCESAGSEWDGRILSLSENGCLLRSSESILLGQKIQLELDLPRADPIAIEAEAAYQLMPDMGMVFNAIDARDREALSRYVERTILAL